MSGIVFFSGGTALRALARELAAREVFSSHIITTFDSGGSSRALRLAFAMPAVGDLRNRLLALARAPAPVISLLNHRLDARVAPLASILDVFEALARNISSAERMTLARDLRFFLQSAPADFDARNASMGNLALAGAYLRMDRQLGAAINFYADFLNIQGEILPASADNLQLGALLANGQRVLGQHLFKDLPAPVARIFLADGAGAECRCYPLPRTLQAIAAAKLICFPMGSFYSSIMVNLLPRGIGEAIAKSAARKLFIPDSGADPELGGLDLADQAARIIKYLRLDAPEAANGQMLNAILIDPRHGDYRGGINAAARARLCQLGLEICEADVVTPPGVHSAAALANFLLDAAQ